jgi:deoxycytidylate deaminase
MSSTETGSVCEINERYLKEAISRIYGDDDDFILFGLTGRTGSGCSSVAKLLQTSKGELKHSLYCGSSPSTNEERKQKILREYFNFSWEPFLLIQVRSVITTFLFKCDDISLKNALFSAITNTENRTKFEIVLTEIESLYVFAEENIGTQAYVEFYTEILPRKCEELKSVVGESAFVKLYQTIGKNIRVSGNAFSDVHVAGAFFTIAEKINDIVKLIRLLHKGLGQKTYIVIDAIRNPLEALFFQDKYSAFFLMAVSAPESDRRGRLVGNNYSGDDIRVLDESEYVSKDVGNPEFYSMQDIKSCLERADVYISNPNVSNVVSRYHGLASQLIKFVCLVRRPGIVTPSPVERCMQMAYTAKLNSGCISRQVGAVVTDSSFSIKSIGWNDVPFGQVPCNLRNRHHLLNGEDDAAYSKFERTDADFLGHLKNGSGKYISISEEGRNTPFCFKSEYNSLKRKDNQVFIRALHAEENAFLQLAKYGGPGVEGGFLFSTASPCDLCAKKAYQLGMKKIFYIDPYPGISGPNVLESGSNQPELVLFSGAIGRAFHRLYSPVVPYKDELNALSSN